MKTKLSKLFRSMSLIMTLSLLLGMLSTTAFAAGTASITISKGNVTTDWTGMEVTAYQVLKQANDQDTNRLYTVNNDFKDFFDIDTVKTAFAGSGTVYLGYDASANKLVASTSIQTGYFQITNTKALDQTYPEADLLNRVGNNSATFYTWVEKYIEAKKGSFTQTPVTAIADTTFVVENLEDGYYALTFSKVPTGISVQQGILIAAPALGGGSATINLKAEDIPNVKTVKNYTKEQNAAYAAEASAKMGDILEYQITSKVPTLTDYSNLTQFKFTDTLECQTAVTSSMTVKIGTTTLTRSGKEFKDGQTTVATLTLGAYDDGKKEQSFTLDFDLAALSAHQGETVTLTYRATLTADAVQRSGNTVDLDYTNNGEPQVLTDTTDVYTYGIEVSKTFSDQSTNYSGVTFNLYTDTEYQKGDGKNPMTLYGTDGAYKPTGTSAVTDLKLDSNGKLAISGLDVGTYWLVETASAQGFNVAEPIQITLVADDEDKAVLDADATTVAYAGGTTLTSKTIGSQATTQISQVQFQVYNQKGFTLPQTGGAGTWMFTLGGVALIVMAGTLFVYTRRKRCK